MIFSTENLSGSKSWGLGKYFSSCRETPKEAIIGVLAGILCPSMDNSCELILAAYGAVMLSLRVSSITCEEYLKNFYQVNDVTHLGGM